MKAPRPGASRYTYLALLAAALVVSLIASATIGAQIDLNAYDFMFRLYQPPPWQTTSIILAIDELSLQAVGGMRNLRRPLAAALHQIAFARPTAVAIDVILADAHDPAADSVLEDALRAVPNLALATELIEGGREWEDPIPRFRRFAAALGHVHADPDKDWVNRVVSLEKYTSRERRWALALEAYRLGRRAPIVESPTDVQIGETIIPTPRTADGRLMRIRFLPPSMEPVPRISLKRLRDDPGLAIRFRGKTVFVGVTAQTEVRDRLATPYSDGTPMPGVEMHANAFETIAQQRFITSVSWSWVLLFCLALTAAIGAAWARLPGWLPYPAGVALLIAAHFTPYVFFTHNRVFSFVMPASTAWLATFTAAAWQLLVVRRSLGRSEAERNRYQQAMHFVTHEMRTPLSAIQGSSELISSYALPEEKRKQIAGIINSESKRLARMIEVFLNVEKLSAGQMELKHEAISIRDLVDVCIFRTRPLADRKRISIELHPISESLTVTGDRELMEYACYNLLTNAVKYSPQQTQVTVSGSLEHGFVRVAVADQGIGMDQKEVRKIFQKFYRTRRAEESGEAGTGIGLSIVQQIVEQHGGSIEVTSRPGEGSCFTLVLPAAAHSAAPAAAE
jgi:signal transduction histidine kinase